MGTFDLRRGWPSCLRKLHNSPIRNTNALKKNTVRTKTFTILTFNKTGIKHLIPKIVIFCYFTISRTLIYSLHNLVKLVTKKRESYYLCQELLKTVLFTLILLSLFYLWEIGNRNDIISMIPIFGFPKTENLEPSNNSLTLRQSSEKYPTNIATFWNDSSYVLLPESY